MVFMVSVNLYIIKVKCQHAIWYDIIKIKVLIISVVYLSNIYMYQEQVQAFLVFVDLGAAGEYAAFSPISIVGDDDLMD